MITIKHLTTPEMIAQACELLYEVYIRQQKWAFNTDNPSRIRIDTNLERNILIDRYSSTAVWFGAFDDEKIVGCVRLVGLDEDGKLEVDTYPSGQSVHQFLSFKSRGRCYDISKMATRKDYVGKGIVKRLLLACFRFCQENKFSAFAFTHNGYLKSLLKKIDFPSKIEQASFRFEPHDISAVNFYFADFEGGEVNETLKKLEYLESDISNNAKNIFKALITVESIIPTPFYWMDAEGVVLGINDLALKAMGTTREIIGKKPYAFYKREIADHILKHNDEVIHKELILSQEEWIEDITTKERKCFSSIKTPLYDDEGTIIGIVGTSIEITAQKEAEQFQQEANRLQHENELQAALLQEKEKFFIKVARKVAHDINSPLATLKMMMPSCGELHESKRNILNQAINSILDIANNLLGTYRKEEPHLTLDAEPREPLLISDMLVQLLSEKKVQFSNRPAKFETDIEDKAHFAFIQMQPSQFRRSMSNLINNAIDALDGNSNGVVTVKLSVYTEFLVVTVQDNGKGMSASAVEKMQARQSFTEGKSNGHGLGLQQVWDTLDYNEGIMNIESTQGLGTAIQLAFPRIEAASWIAFEIQPTSNSIVVILDDDESIHGAWDLRFKPYLHLNSALRSHHFTNGQKILDFFEKLSAEEKERVLFLSDYELIGQQKDGLQIIAESRIKNATLVTSYYANSEIRDKARRLGVKVLPKQMASIVPISVTADGS